MYHKKLHPPHLTMHEHSSEKIEAPSEDTVAKACRSVGEILRAEAQQDKSTRMRMDALGEMQRYLGQVLLVQGMNGKDFQEEILEQAAIIGVGYPSNENMRQALDTILRVFCVSLSNLDAILQRKVVPDERVEQMSGLWVRTCVGVLRTRIREEIGKTEKKEE